MADRVRPTLLVLVCTGALLACGGASDEETSGGAGEASTDLSTGDPAADDPSDASSDDDATTQADDPTTGDDAVTEADDGEAIVLSVGQELPLRLSSKWAWSDPQLSDEIVTLAPVDHLVDPGYVEWLVTGTAPGTATMSVEGDPNCADPAECPSRSLTLQFEVTG